MISEALRGRETTVEVVNLRPAPVIEQLIRLGVRKTAIRTIRGSQCVRNWIEGERDNLASRVVDDLRTKELDGQEMLYVGGSSAAAVAKAARPRGTLGDILVIPDAPAPGGKVADPVRVETLRPMLRNARRLMVAAGKQRLAVVDFTAERPPNPNAGPGMVYLLPAGRS